VSDEIRRSRERFERSLDALRKEFAGELGWAPRVSRWVLPLVAGTVGLVAGLTLRRNLPRLLPPRR